eukprot:jgi/Psemu1/285876/fgenesh1_pg.107_\
MPTLVSDPNLFAKAASKSRNGGTEEDKSITIFSGDESTVVDENYRQNSCSSHKSGSDCDNISKCESRSSILSSSSRRGSIQKNVTFFDESMMLMSTAKKGRFSRRETLNSDVSLSLLSCENTTMRDESSIVLSEPNTNCTKQGTSIESSRRSDGVRTWPRRDEYCSQHQQYVKSVISNFESKFPGKLRDYRSMSVEEKAEAQQKVLVLLGRLRVSKTNEVGSNSTASPSVHTEGSFRSPVANSYLLDETMSPLFSPNPRPLCDDDLHADLPPSNEGNDGQTQKEVQQNQSQTICEKSELLLSMEDHDTSNMDFDNQDDVTQNNDSPLKVDPVGFEFPVDQDDVTLDNDSPPRMDPNSTCTTPNDRKISNPFSRKREATTSGKRGADLRRSRHDYGEDECDVSVRLGRLSVSPSASSPPKDLFITSQSPISPRLTYRSPDVNDGNDYYGDDYGGRMSLGIDSDSRRESNLRKSRTKSDLTNDSLATNTPPIRYRSDKGKRRAFREVPVNIALKKGATFHLEKIAVKRTERFESKPVTSKSRQTKPMKRHRLVNFPDPLVRYGSRTRRALKEMYSWIIDLSLKLLLSDYAEKPEESDRKKVQSPSVLRGNTLVVLRAKEDSTNWENALREGTGCSVLNHASLPLSERIRASTSEKACLYDVVLTTYDAMKSPDVAIPLSTKGRAIVTKPKTDGGWHTTRGSQEDHQIHRQTKQLSILHRIQFKRIIFVDTLGRRSYLAKSGTARAVASIAITSSSSRLVFFEETEVDGSNALLALRKSDKRAFQSVSSVLHLIDNANESDICDSSDDEGHQDPLEEIVMDLKDLIC